MYCKSCCGIDISDLRSCEVVQQPSFAALKNSAEAGCEFCNFTYTAIVSKYPQFIETLCRGQDPTKENNHDTGIYLDGRVYDHSEWNALTSNYNQVTVRVGEFSPGENSVQADLRVCADIGNPPAKYIAGRIPSQNPGDPTSMLRVRNWVQNCDRKHKKCASLSVDKPLPKRVLDIRGKPVVHHTNGAKGRYMALSYCWGSSGKNILLTKEQGPAGEIPTFDEFISVGVEVGRLAKTIQDAITVCRNLGINYLWVDALCIVQEERDLKDFIDEAPRMSEYYSNAYLTIIAGSARDCADGFLNERPKPKSAPCEIVYTRKGLPSHQDMTGSVKLSLPYSRDIGPVQERAWTYQESKMSQRYLIYRLEQISFSCTTCILFEDGDFYRIAAPDESPPSDPLANPTVHDFVKDGNKTDVTTNAYKLWSSGILGYTSRSMSNPLDKLAAIAGYAKYFHKILQCRYMYGLWEGDLLSGLMWRTYRPWTHSNTQKPTARSANRAPSWSWASIDGPILPAPRTWVEKLQDPKLARLKILSYENVPDFFDPIRSNRKGPQAFELVVSGFPRKVWHVPKSTGGGALSSFALLKSQPSFDVWDIAELQKKEIQDELSRERVAVGDWDTYDDLVQKAHWGSPMYALPIIPTVGLLLVNVNGSSYRRIGLFKEGKEEFFEHLGLKEITLI